VSQRSALTEAEASTWMPFAAVLELLPAGLNSRLLREVGQPLLNLYVLGHLRHEPGKQAGLSELAACVNSALPRMSRIVARLADDGLVSRSSCSSDGRAITVAITPAGEALLGEAMPLHDRLVRELLIDALSPIQLDQLRDIATTLAARLHPDIASPMDRQRSRAT